MLRYALLALLAKPGRSLAITASFALAFASVLITHAIAAQLDLTASAALRFIVGDSSVWISGSGFPQIDLVTRTLAQDRPLNAEIEEALRIAPPEGFRRLAVQRTYIHGLPVSVYFDDRATDARVSPRLASQFRPSEASIGSEPFIFAGIDPALPGMSIRVPFDGKSEKRRPTWIFASPDDATGWARAFAARHNLDLRDSAGIADPARGAGYLFLIGGSLSRFDPFSFATKFSAFELNRANSTLLAWLARAIFLFGAATVVTSARMGIGERSAEIAALAVLGYQPELTLLILIENSILLAVAIPLAYLTSWILAASILPIEGMRQSLVSSLGMTLFLVPVVLVVATLWAGQYVAGRDEVALVRGAA